MNISSIGNLFEGHQKLAAQILEILVKLAENAPELGEGKIHTANFDGLQVLLPKEHHADFNEDMSQCIYMTGIHHFSLAPEVVATNILPHYANFLASMIVGNLINYRAEGCPTALKIEVDHTRLATATIQWAYSLAGVEDVQLPVVDG